MRFKRFTKPGFLKEIGRDLLGRFFDKFAIAARQTFRAPTLTETEAFFEELKTHGGMQAGKWFDENGLDERWASPSLETSGTSLGGGSRANIWAKTPQA